VEKYFVMVALKEPATHVSEESSGYLARSTHDGGFDEK
jgi:hypothetical protein